VQVVLQNRFTFMEAPSSWWQLFDPQVTDDFLALRMWLGEITAARDAAQARLTRRVDAYWPQYQRDILDGLVDLTITGEAWLQKHHMFLRHPNRFGSRVWNTFAQVSPELGWTELMKGAYAARFAGVRGMIVRESLGAEADWQRASEDAMLYPPHSEFSPDGPAVSFRVKTLRRAQQDMDLFEQVVAKAPVSEGYVLAELGAQWMARGEVRTPRYVTLLPQLVFPGRYDSVAAEEIRRAIRESAGR
jgi:hypothetical protein